MEYFRGVLPVKLIARAFDVSRATVYLWAMCVLRYEGSDADDVRSLARVSRRRTRSGRNKLTS